METVSFKIPIRNIPVFKGAAKELSIDLITETFDQGDEWVNVHAIVHDLTSLIGLAFNAGTDSMYMAIKNPMTQVVDNIERQLEAINNKSKKQTP